MDNRPRTSPDIVLLGTEWRLRALLCAQLIEQGLDVRAADTWDATRRLLRPGVRPVLAVVDLQGLPHPDRVLDELAVVMKPSRVIVLTAIGTVSPDDIRTRGFHVLGRPIPISDIVAAAVRVIGEEKS